MKTENRKLRALIEPTAREKSLLCFKLTQREVESVWPNGESFQYALEKVISPIARSSEKILLYESFIENESFFGEGKAILKCLKKERSTFDVNLDCFDPMNYSNFWMNCMSDDRALIDNRGTICFLTRLNSALIDVVTNALFEPVVFSNPRVAMSRAAYRVFKEIQGDKNRVVVTLARGTGVKLLYVFAAEELMITIINYVVTGQ